MQVVAGTTTIRSIADKASHLGPHLGYIQETRKEVTLMLDAERCCEAVERRDASFDGRFFTAVRTTGIYCMPSCSARTPKRENVSFFRDAAEAEASGYRACKRCHPNTL
jgi:methylphosphotriester-DNA--protein-cysteine methyltransferase